MNFILVLYRNRNVNTGALLLRLLLGILFVSAGWGKVTHIDMVIGFFGGMGFSPFQAYLVGYTELIAGLLVLVGLFQKPATVALAVIMAVVVWGLPGKPNDIFFGHNYDFVLLGTLISLYFIGSGKYSLSHWIQSRRGVQA